MNLFRVFELSTARQMSYDISRVRYINVFNPLTSPARKIFGLKSAYIQACKQHIFDGPITALLSILYILVEVLSHAHAKRRKRALMVSNLALLLVVFLSDGAASTAVKGLITALDSGVHL